MARSSECISSTVAFAVFDCVQPSAVLAYLSRTPASLIEHGENVSAAWSPDSTRIVIQVAHSPPIPRVSCPDGCSQTADSYLVLVTLEYSADETVYQSPSLVSSVRGKYLAGPGEGFPLQAVNLRFEGVIRVEGDLLWCAELFLTLPTHS